METSAKICLLIDDDRDDQEIFTLALEKVDPDFRCVIANNGYEGLKYLANKNNPLPRYIFLDLNMPLMNGKECLIEIKKLSFLRSVPVIIYSTSSLQDDVIQTRKLGAADFITKPPSIPVLSSKLLSSIRALERRVPVEATLPKI
jgi:DNA-binding response OmpR family regulator